MDISQLILELKEGEIAKATFATAVWYVIKKDGFIRYYYEIEKEIEDTVPLTYSNLNAEYEILK